MRLSQLLVLAAFAPFAFAYPTFTAPAAGATETAAVAFTVTWADNGVAPSISDISTYQLDLCAASDSAADLVVVYPVVTTTTLGSTLTNSVSVPAAQGGSTKNA